jgi:hypothetical protein
MAFVPNLFLSDSHFSTVAPSDHPGSEAPTLATLPAGYAYLSFSNSKTDDTCTKTSVSVGVPANTCVAAKDYSYKIQLVAGAQPILTHPFEPPRTNCFASTSNTIAVINCP